MTTTLITGANRSLGLETTRRLLDAGHTVYAAMRDPATGDAARELGAYVVQLDVTDAASVQAGIAALPELDVLVNNAGILGDSFDVDADTMTRCWAPTWWASCASSRPRCRCCGAQPTR